MLRREVLNGILLDKRPSGTDFYNKAVKLIEDQNSKKQEVVDKLKSEVEALKTKLALKEKELICKRLDLFDNGNRIVEKEIFFTNKKIK